MDHNVFVRKLRFVLVCLLLLSFFASICLFILPAFATTWGNENFESFNTKSWWHVTVPPPSIFAKSAEQHQGTGSYSVVVNTTGTGYGYAYNETSVIGTNFHYSIWIYAPAGVTQYGALVSEPYDGSNVDFRTTIKSNSTGYYLSVGDPTGSAYDNITLVPTATWFHVEEYYVRAAGRLDIYVNGVNQSQGTWNRGVLASVSPYRFYLGDVSGTGTQYDGKLFYDNLVVDDASEVPADTTPPTITNMAVNSTEPYTVCNFTATVADNIAVWKTIFSTNLTGSWANDSAVVWANYTSILANTTKTLSVTVGNWGYIWYAEDNSTNNATSGIQTIMVGIIDYYSESHYQTDIELNMIHPADNTHISDFGSAYTSLGTTHNVSLVKFYLKKVGSPTGTAYAVIYAHSGTYGTNSLPTGSALATSDGFDVSTLTTSYQLISFTFSTTFVMSTTTHYCVDFQNPTSGTLDSSNYIFVGYDSSGAAGRSAFYYQNAWYSEGGYTCAVFYVYGIAASASSVNYNLALAFSITSAYSEVSKWTAKIALSRTVTSVYGMSQDKWSSKILLARTITLAYGEVDKWSSKVSLTQSITSAYGELGRWASKVPLSRTITSSYSTLSKWSAIIRASYVFTSAYNLKDLRSILVSLSYSMSTTWNMLSKWSSNARPTLHVTFGFNMGSPFSVGGGLTDTEIATYAIVAILIACIIAFGGYATKRKRDDED